MRLTHSYSSIKLFENCPKRYELQRIQKVLVDEGGEASIYGDRVHKSLETRLKEDTDLPQELERYEELCRAVEKLVSLGGELHIEKELVLNDNLLPTGWWDADAWLRSKLDVLVLNGNTAVVMDWKTGKRRPDFFQMAVFAVQVFKHYPEVTKVKTSLVWLKDMAMDTEIYRREEANSLWADIMSRIKRIHIAQENDTWPAKPSGLCNYCPAKAQGLCEFAR